VKYARCAAIADLDQLKEPPAVPAAAAAVDPCECCASRDPLPPPETLWLPAVAV
jgi:hypothetical protein